MKSAVLTILLCASVAASSPDPQVKTDHPWYPGELSCSTFERLFATQSELYRRTTGREVASDEDKALASWYWRNLNYFHADTAACNGGRKGEFVRDYWTGLFAYGFGLCGTTHAQWTAEFEALLGHCRSRVTGTTGHNSFEVFLAGGPYGDGRWALLDHDLSTVAFSADGSRMLSLEEVMRSLKDIRRPPLNRPSQHGWRIAGLHDDDPAAYTSFRSAEYLAAYAGPPPLVNLRPGETLRRYLLPGLEDGKTFVFWGPNFNSGGIPGPERSRTWVNQPAKMFNSTAGSGFEPGQARYGNAVYTYAPNFADGSYREGVVDEDPEHVTFGFVSPYVVAATPPNEKTWGVYDAGCKNGLVVTAARPVAVEVSVDGGASWSGPANAGGITDLTDQVKGHTHYLLRFRGSAAELRDARPSWRTVCQCNAALIPHLKGGGSRVTFASSGRALTAPVTTTKGRVVTVSVPADAQPGHLYAHAWNLSGNPPDPAIAYRIDYSTDAGRTWAPVVKDWRVAPRPPNPPDFWSQSFTWGDVALPEGTPSKIQVRFSNSAGKGYREVSATLAYEVRRPQPTEVTFAWTESDGGVKKATHTYPAAASDEGSWVIPTGANPRTLWVEYAARPPL